MRLSRSLPLIGLLAVTGCARIQLTDPLAILRANRDAMFALPIYKAECKTHRTYDRSGGLYVDEYSKLTAEKRNKMHYDQWEGGPNRPVDLARTPDITFVCSGTVSSLQYGKHYHIKIDDDPAHLSTILEPWDGFYTKETSILGKLEEQGKSSAKKGTYDLKYVGTANVGNIACDIVQVHRVSDYLGDKLEQTGKYYIGEQDHLVRRLVDHTSFNDKPGFTADAIIEHIDLHPATSLDQWHYRPPAGVTLEDESLQRSAPLLPNGLQAPEFPR